MGITVISVDSVFPVRVALRDQESGEVVVTVAFVDYATEKVYFPSHPEFENSEEVKLAVLENLDYDVGKIPQADIPQEIWEDVAKVMSPEYRKSLVESEHIPFNCCGQTTEPSESEE